MLRVVKPKTKRAKRALDAKAPKVVRVPSTRARPIAPAPGLTMETKGDWAVGEPLILPLHGRSSRDM